MFLHVDTLDMNDFYLFSAVTRAFEPTLSINNGVCNVVRYCKRHQWW